jgi:hypothetical protein
MTMERLQSLLLLSSVDGEPRSIPIPAIFALLRLAIPEATSARSGHLGQDLLHLGCGESA